MTPHLRFLVCLGIAFFCNLPAPLVHPDDWPMLGRDGTRNSVSREKSPPLDWAGVDQRASKEPHADRTRNIKWTARLGSRTLGTPVVAGGRIFVGTNNGGERLKRYHDVDLGCMLCFREADGEFLWQFSSEKLSSIHQDWPLSGIGATPLVEGDRMWFVTNRREVVCLDVAGFLDGEDDGPVKTQRGRLFNVASPRDPTLVKDHLPESVAALNEGLLTRWLRSEFERTGMPLPHGAMVAPVKKSRRWSITAHVHGVMRRFHLHMEEDRLAVYKVITPADREEADVVWQFDMIKELGISPRSVHAGPNRHGSPATYRDRIYVTTGNGTNNEDSIPAPDAPSLLCVDKKTGKVLWADASPGKNILENQIGDPLVVEINGRPQVIVGQGDGWVRSFNALTGELIWKFDINAKKSKWVDSFRGKRQSIAAAPVFYGGRVYIASGRKYEGGVLEGRLVCIDPTKAGDISPELAMDAKRRPLPQRRVQAVVRKKGEKATANPNSGLIWEYTGFDQNGNKELEFEEVFHCTLSSVTVKDDLVIAADLGGVVHCLDAVTGKLHWTHDMFSDAVSAPLIVDDWVYVADGDGDVGIFRLSADPDVAMKKVDGEYLPHVEIYTDPAIWSAPIFANGVLYITSRSNLWAIAAPEDK